MNGTLKPPVASAVTVASTLPLDAVQRTLTSSFASKPRPVSVIVPPDDPDMGDSLNHAGSNTDAMFQDAPPVLDCTIAGTSWTVPPLISRVCPPAAGTLST